MHWFKGPFYRKKPWNTQYFMGKSMVSGSDFPSTPPLCIDEICCVQPLGWRPPPTPRSSRCSWRSGSRGSCEVQRWREPLRYLGRRCGKMWEVALDALGKVTTSWDNSPIRQIRFYNNGEFLWYSDSDNESRPFPYHILYKNGDIFHSLNCSMCLRVYQKSGLKHGPWLSIESFNRK